VGHFDLIQWQHVQSHQGDANMPKVIYRLPAVNTESGLSRSTLYLRIAQGLWTKPISLGGRTVGWPACEVAALNAARIAGQPDEAIRVLVQKLEAARKAVA
jgi:prophage regulatory protein